MLSIAYSVHALQKYELEARIWPPHILTFTVIHLHVIHLHVIHVNVLQVRIIDLPVLHQNCVSMVQHNIYTFINPW